MQLRSKFFAVALAAAGLVASNASAATVTYTLDLSIDNVFSVLASASAGDNGGITTYGIPLSGNVLTLDHVSPTVFKLSPNGNAGFANLRSADSAGPISNPTLTGAQDLATPNLVYGFGQTPGTFTGTFFPNDPTSQTTWGAPLLIATGTYNRSAGTLSFGSGATLLANVFDDGTGNERIAADVSTSIIPFGLPLNTAPIVTSDGGSLGETQTFNGQIITHDFDAIDAETPAGPFTWNVALNGSPTFLFPGAVDNSAFPTIDSNGTFSWNTLGAARGIYNWLITASDPGGETSTPQQFAVTVTAVPEPSTIALFGLAMVGALGFVRRRNG